VNEKDFINKVHEIETKLDYIFLDKKLILEAFTHSSFSNESNLVKLNNNERLEFLGDAVLGLIIAQTLMNMMPTKDEGELSRRRSSLISRNTLCEISLSLGLNEYLLLGKGERISSGDKKSSILCSLFEAVVGAIYMDGGLESARKFINKVFKKHFSEMLEISSFKVLDNKSYFQEKIQHLYKKTPSYMILETWGLEHDKYFKVGVFINGKKITEAVGKSKKEAEKLAAGKAIEIMGFLKNSNSTKVDEVFEINFLSEDLKKQFVTIDQ